MEKPGRPGRGQPLASGDVIAGDLCNAVAAGRPCLVRVLIGFGSHLVISQPGSDRTAAALCVLVFQVHLDRLHDATIVSADIVLPVNGASEHAALHFGFETDHRVQ
ncbi:hypothetical protein ACFVYE_42460 [Streptomyces sp. NPDC058239]|uniref:hypothetical protein n=1 Tax=Streptomyces sp. NPDC058239 TaxID=3346395 RepID=UPI0036E29E79